LYDLHKKTGEPVADADVQKVMRSVKFEMFADNDAASVQHNVQSVSSIRSQIQQLLNEKPQNYQLSIIQRVSNNADTIHNAALGVTRDKAETSSAHALANDMNKFAHSSEASMLAKSALGTKPDIDDGHAGEMCGQTQVSVTLPKLYEKYNMGKLINLPTMGKLEKPCAVDCLIMDESGLKKIEEGVSVKNEITKAQVKRLTAWNLY